MKANEVTQYSPYKGLIPYNEQDADFFFGREKDTRLIIANLFASPLTILYGPSGVGKSSILRAGVMHQLRQRGDVQVLIFSAWKEDPVTALKFAVRELPGKMQLPDDGLSLADYIVEYASINQSRLMIILDQFEEYFLYHPEQDEFTSQFAQAVTQTDVPISFLISIREDGLAKLDRFEGYIPILFDNYLRLEHLGETAARMAIEKPIEKFNEKFSLSENDKKRIEPGLADEVIQQLKTEQVSLGKTGLGVIERDSPNNIETPYLQLVMTRLWQTDTSSGSNLLRLSTLRSLGGAKKIVRTHLDEVLNRLNSTERGLASRIFQFLVTPSGSKIALRPSDLAKYADAKLPMVQSLLQRLAAQDIRLLRAVPAMGANETSYEIFHDVLASPILDWRGRQVRSSRSSLLILLGIVVLFICVYVGFSFIFGFSSVINPELGGTSPASTEELLGMLATFVPVFFCTALFCLIPIAIGFYLGRGWTRAR